MFKKKIVSGQVCYETEIKIQKLRYLGVDWNSLLQRGVGLFIDTNEEFDVLNLLEPDTSTRGKPSICFFMNIYLDVASD